MNRTRTDCNTTITLSRKDRTVRNFGEITGVNGAFRTAGYYTAVISKNCNSAQEAVDEAMRELDTGRWFACTVIFMGRHYDWKGPITEEKR